MRHEQTFEVALPVAIAHRHWRRFGEAKESAGGQVRFEPIGQDRTRVKLVMEEPECVQKTVEDFTRFVEEHRSEGGPRAAKPRKKRA